MMVNQYHEDDQLNEILMWLDNAHDQFKKRYGNEYPIELRTLRNTYDDIVDVIKNESPDGFIE